jgi:NAD(P)-dependent dehydrogenase (short-subunit alcohol dehydrogenase family)
MSGGVHDPDPRLSEGFDLRGRTALVTGAGSVSSGIGIGRAAAVLLAEAGARVALLDRSRAAAEQTLHLLEGRGGEGLAVEADVGDPDSLRAAVEQTVQSLGPVDILVNNVGVVGPPGTAEEVDVVAWDEAMRVNVTAMVSTAKLCIPLMRTRGSGSIVNVSSVAGMVGGYPSLFYPTSKGAVISLTRAMAAHHGPDGIRVNAVAPGTLYTPRVAVRGMSEEMRAARRMGSPLRSEGTGWDAGYAIVYLASDAARWVTGVVLPVDAGVTAVLPLQSPPADGAVDR